MHLAIYIRKCRTALDRFQHLTAIRKLTVEVENFHMFVHERFKRTRYDKKTLTFLKSWPVKFD